MVAMHHLKTLVKSLKTDSAKLQSTRQLSCHLSSVKQQSLKLLYRKVLEIVQQMEFIPTITILFG